MAGTIMPDDERAQGFGKDLNPDLDAGMNMGLTGRHPIKEGGVRTAYDDKRLHDRLQDFNDQELKDIPILPAGTRLEQGATYIDLSERNPKEFTASAQMVAGTKNRYVPKADVSYVLWNRLIGVENPERLDMADEGTTNQFMPPGPSESTGNELFC